MMFAFSPLQVLKPEGCAHFRRRVKLYEFQPESSSRERGSRKPPFERVVLARARAKKPSSSSIWSFAVNGPDVSGVRHHFPGWALELMFLILR